MVFIQEIISSKIKDEAYIINLDEFKPIGTHWIATYTNAENVIYFDCFGVKQIQKEIRKLIWKKKYYKEYLQNARIQFNNFWILLY